MKYLKIIVVTTIIMMLLSIISLEIFYQYKVNQIKPIKTISDVKYSKQTIDVLWITLEGKGSISLESFSATKFVYSFIKASTFYSINDYRSSFPKGMSLANHVARNHVMQTTASQLDWQLSNMVVSIWVSNHYTDNEASNYIINTIFYGKNIFGLTNASEFYFGKKVENLSLSEIISLISIIKAPSYFSPYCNPERHRERSKTISKKLKENWPLKYNKFTYSLPVFKLQSDVCK